MGLVLLVFSHMLTWVVETVNYDGGARLDDKTYTWR